jgi:hypothetical protein
MLNTNQIKALADALACSGLGKRGLERQSGRRFDFNERCFSQ